MTGFMPSIYPDELVYSWFCRYFVHSGYSTNKMALEDILYNRHCNPSKEFIGHLNPGMEETIKKVYPIDELVLGHTMFPQYARFIGPDKKKDALYHLGHEFCDAHQLFSILPRSASDQFLKYCPLCAEEDRKLYGETYWHRKHQIRNMNLCAKHRCRLVNSAVPAKSEQTFTLDAAESAVQSVAARLVTDPLEMEYASYMEEIFDSPVDFESDIPVSAVLYYGMNNTKYMKSTGKTRNSRLLADDMQEYYRKMNLGDIASYYQVQRTLLGNGFDFLVVSQIAFFLGISVENLVKPALSKEQILKEQKARYPQKEDCPRDWDKYDAKMVPIVERAAFDVYHGNINDTGRPERISERLLNKYAGLSAHRLEKLPKCREVLKKYMESYDENRARRIVWAYKKLRDEKPDQPVFWTDIRKLSGVKKKNLPGLLPELDKYADKKTVNAIRDLINEPQ